jgi:hypothetical protein
MVQDGVIDTLRIFAGWRPGPLRAIEAFLKTHPEFEVDTERCTRFLIRIFPKAGSAGLADRHGPPPLRARRNHNTPRTVPEIVSRWIWASVDVEFKPIMGAFRIPALVPGEYSLDVESYDRTGVTLDEIHGATCMEVLKDDYISMVDSYTHYMGNMIWETWVPTR